MRILTLLAVGFYLLATTFSCVIGRPTQIPTQIQFNTRSFIDVRWQDSTVRSQVAEIAKSGLPNEIGMCLYGTAKDTIVTYTDSVLNETETAVLRIALIQRAEKANIDTVSPRFVYYKDPECNLHRDLIGIAHTHPLAFPVEGFCHHSDTDITSLNKWARRYWFSMVVCPGGYMEVRWVDGRAFEYTM